MTNREKMQQAIAEKQAAQAKAEIEAAAKPEEPKKVKIDKPKGPQVTYKCGHKVGLKQLEDIPCPGCRNKVRREFNIERQKLIAERSKNDSQRLPDGAEFHAVYDADAKRWKGSLFLGPVGERTVLSDDSGAVMKLLGKLDQQYRAWLANQSSQEPTE